MQSTEITRTAMVTLTANSAETFLWSDFTARKSLEQICSPCAVVESNGVASIKASGGTCDSDNPRDSRAAAYDLFTDPECSTSDSDPDSTVITVESKDAATTPRTSYFPSANSTEDSEDSKASTDESEKETEKPKLGYVIFPKPIPVNESEERTYQIGTFDGTPIYHFWSPAEQFLSSFEYRTPFGKRFLFDEPDNALPPEDETDTNYQPPSGVWWPGPGNANKKFSFQRYFAIRPSKLGGLGAYATADIEFGRVILVERPLLLTTHAKFAQDVLALSPSGLAIYKSLDGNHSHNWVEEIKNRNCFDVGAKIGFFAIASRFNHACRRASNVSYTYDQDRKVMVLAAKEDIEAGTELTINYGAGSSAALYAMYGFVCRCGACRLLTRRDLMAMGADWEECARWGLVSERETVW